MKILFSEGLPNTVVIYLIDVFLKEKKREKLVFKWNAYQN